MNNNLAIKSYYSIILIEFTKVKYGGSDMGFIKEVVASTIEFVFMAAVVVGGVFAGMKLRMRKNAKESQSLE